MLSPATIATIVPSYVAALLILVGLAIPALLVYRRALATQQPEPIEDDLLDYDTSYLPGSYLGSEHKAHAHDFPDTQALLDQGSMQVKGIREVRGNRELGVGVRA